MQRIYKLIKPTDQWLPSIEKYPEEYSPKNKVDGELDQTEKEKDFAAKNGMENSAYVTDEKTPQMENSATPNVGPQSTGL